MMIKTALLTMILFHSSSSIANESPLVGTWQLVKLHGESAVPLDDEIVLNFKDEDRNGANNTLFMSESQFSYTAFKNDNCKDSDLSLIQKNVDDYYYCSSNPMSNKGTTALKNAPLNSFFIKSSSVDRFEGIALQFGDTRDTGDLYRWRFVGDVLEIEISSFRGGGYKDYYYFRRKQSLLF